MPKRQCPKRRAGQKRISRAFSHFRPMPVQPYLDLDGLERYVVVADWRRMFRFRHTLIHIMIRSAAATGRIATGSAFTGTQEDEVVADNFCHVLFLLRRLILPRACL